MKCAVTGSFDPITRGHIDIIERASRLFDEVYVVVLNNEGKNYMFNLEDREKIARYTLANNERVKVYSYRGYVVDFCREHDIRVVVRGYRNPRDFEYETDMSRWNNEHGEIETIILPQDKKSHVAISSTVARENMNNEEVISTLLDERTIHIIKEITKDGE